VGRPAASRGHIAEARFSWRFLSGTTGKYSAAQGRASHNEGRPCRGWRNNSQAARYHPTFSKALPADTIPVPAPRSRARTEATETERGVLAGILVANREGGCKKKGGPNLLTSPLRAALIGQERKGRFGGKSWPPGRGAKAYDDYKCSSGAKPVCLARPGSGRIRLPIGLLRNTTVRGTGVWVPSRSSSNDAPS